MQILYNIFNTILDAGAVVMLPIIINHHRAYFPGEIIKGFQKRPYHRHWLCGY